MADCQQWALHKFATNERRDESVKFGMASRYGKTTGEVQTVRGSWPRTTTNINSALVDRAADIDYSIIKLLETEGHIPTKSEVTAATEALGTVWAVGGIPASAAEQTPMTKGTFYALWLL